MKKMSYKFLMMIQLISLILLSPVYGQDSQGSNTDDMFQDSLQDLYIVAGLGAGGAILGLSTLSFVDQPQDHLKNIIVGAALGIIVGVGVVAYKQANKSSEEFKASVEPDFSTHERFAWHSENYRSHQVQEKSPLSFNYTISF